MAPTRSTSPASIAANRSSDALAMATPSHYRLYLLRLSTYQMAARRTSPTREAEAVAEKLHSAALLLLRRLRTEDDPRGISPPRLSALSVVVDAGPIGIGALAAAEGVSAPTMSRLGDGLERDALDGRAPNPDHTRGGQVRATVPRPSTSAEHRGHRHRRRPPQR